MGAEAKMKTLLLEVVEAGITKLYTLWDELGLDTTSKIDRNYTVQKHFQDILDTMVEEENTAKEKILKSLQINNKKAVKLSKELGVKFISPDSSLVLIRYEQALRHEVERLAAIKELRIVEFAGLERQEAVLCKQISDPLSDTRYSGVPSVSQIQALKERIQTLEVQKSERFEQFRKLKRSILSMYHELELEPGTSLERDIVCEDEEKFVLSVENINSVTNILSELENRKIVNLKTVEDAILKINSLYDLLQWDFHDKCEFSEELGGCKSSVILKLQTEINRLEMFKKDKIGEIVIEKRNELHDLWDQCFYSPDQRNRFTPLHCIQFTEELLEFHEEEVFKMKEILQENKDIFGKVSQWKETWDKVMELERRSREPARLMGGGNTLLREERQRNKVNKMLPQLEQELCELIRDWEAAHDKEFLVYGVCFANYAQEQKENHALCLEQEKQARNEAKNKMRAQETLTGTRLGETGTGKTFNVNAVGNTKKTEPGSKVKLCWQTPSRGASVQAASPRTAAKRAPGGQMDRVKSLKTRTAKNTNFTSSSGTESCTVTSAVKATINDTRSTAKTTRNDTRGTVKATSNETRSMAKATSNDTRSKAMATSNDTRSTVKATSNDTRSTVNRTRTKTISAVARIKATATRSRRISSESSASSGTRGLRRG